MERAKYLGPARRRPMILDAALEVFAEGGFADASMSAIARRAGVTKPVLYDCFPGGKQEIYLSLLEREEQRFLDHMTGAIAVARRMPLRESLEAGLGAFFDYAEINPSGFRVAFGEAGTADAALQASAERVRARLLSILGERAVDVAVASGASPLFGDVYVRAILAVADHLARWWVKEKPVERAELVRAVVAWMMRGFEGILRGDLLGEPPKRPAPPA